MSESMLPLYSMLKCKCHASSFSLGPRASITHSISKLTPSHVSQKVVLGGWVTAKRQANASLWFLNLKDSSGTVQIVVNLKSFSEQEAQRLSQLLQELPLESVIQVQGVGQEKRAAKSTAPSGQVEIQVQDLKLLNPAEKQLPFYPNTRELVNEDLRNQYRYLDLRRDKLAENIKKRSRVTKLIRDYLHQLEFTEIETPILLQSSPEGAREYLVPTRLNSSPTPTASTEKSQEVQPTTEQPLFYALQQSPQQPKQLLITSGLTDKYFQIARCFRDEDGRKDRQAEFTQVDLEMGFVSGAAPDALAGHDGGNADGTRSTWRIGGSEVREVVEGLIKKVWKEVEGVDLPGWFQVMPYDVAMDVVSLFELFVTESVYNSGPTDVSVVFYRVSSTDRISQIPGSRCMQVSPDPFAY